MIITYSLILFKWTSQKLLIKFHTNNSFINCSGMVLPGTYIVGLIKSFLTDRSQKVIIESVSSSPISVTSGVPQGTVLGPLLFLEYVNDLPDCIQHSTIRLFADDCILHRPIQSESDAILLQEDINSLFTWTIIWQMELNIDKCCSMSVTLSRLHNFSCSYHIASYKTHH